MASLPFLRGGHQAVSGNWMLRSPSGCGTHYAMTACESCDLAILVTQEGVESYC